MWWTQSTIAAGSVRPLGLLLLILATTTEALVTHNISGLVKPIIVCFGVASVISSQPTTTTGWFVA